VSHTTTAGGSPLNTYTTGFRMFFRGMPVDILNRPRGISFDAEDVAAALPATRSALNDLG
jgi:hypothetical protein